MATVTDFDWQDFYPPGVEPTWEVALFYPPQGGWSVDEYLELTERTNQLVEYTAGRIEVLAMPTILHQRIVLFLINALQAAADRGEGGIALPAPLPTTLSPEKIREPNIVFKLRKNLPSPDDNYFQGADLVMEVVSSDKKSRQRDYESKKIDYAEGKILEYWIVDPQVKQITVLTLESTAYAQHGVFGEGETATSKLLVGFSVNVTDVFQAAKA
jgi:Uma2 family endonuclease